MHDYINSTSLGVKAKAIVNNISGTGGVTYPRLCMQLTFQLNEDNGHDCHQIQALVFGVFTAELNIGNEKIGDALPVSISRMGMTYHPYEDQQCVQVEVPLDPRRIEMMEQFRNGKSFTGYLRFSLGVNVFGFPRGPKDSFSDFVGLRDASKIDGQVSFTVPDTQWREQVLPGLGYGKVIAIELPAVPIESIQSLEHSFKALEQAQKQFQLGHYDEAVGKCRVALDPFFELVQKGDDPEKKIPKLKKSWETRLGESTYRWLDESLGTIKVASNKPHHSPNNHFDRLGAQMLMMVITALVSYAARQDGE